MAMLASQPEPLADSAEDTNNDNDKLVLPKPDYLLAALSAAASRQEQIETRGRG